MFPSSHSISIPSQVLVRGFWLYVWKITRLDEPPLYYVGMTGDTGSYKAQSPFNRLAAHLGSNSKSNAIQRYLKLKKIDSGSCLTFDFTAYGPLTEVPTEKAAYQLARGNVSGLEKSLWLALKKADCDMLNVCPNSKFQADELLSKVIFAEFAKQLGIRTTNK